MPANRSTCCRPARHVLSDRVQQRRSTDDASIPTSSRSSGDSRDVAITVEVFDADDAELREFHSSPPRTCRIAIPPVTISSHASTPDDEPAGRSSQFTSCLSREGGYSLCRIRVPIS